jgi:hypothetical protein
MESPPQRPVADQGRIEARVEENIAAVALDENTRHWLGQNLTGGITVHGVGFW